DLQHLCGRGLLLQRLAEIGRTLAQLVEQTGILDGNDGLSGEIRDQLDLLVGERTYLLAINVDRPDQLALLKHRHKEKGPRPCEIGQRSQSRVAMTQVRWL